MLKMGNILTKSKKDIKIINVISKKDLLKYPHFKLRGEIVVRKDLASCIPEIDLCFENYFAVTVRVWLSEFNDAFSMSSAESVNSLRTKRVEFKL